MRRHARTYTPRTKLGMRCARSQVRAAPAADPRFAVPDGAHIAIAAYNPDQPRVPAGQPGGGQFAGDTSGGGSSVARARVERALRTHKPATARKQRWADRSEKDIVRMLGGERTGDNDAVDVVVRAGGKVAGVEVKTILDNGNDKITMHPDSRVRKEAWARSNHATIHTVVIDDRNRFGSSGWSGNRLYYARGVGAFRLTAMTPVRDIPHLRELLKERKRRHASEMVDTLRRAHGIELRELEWDEADHPRNDKGEFVESGAGTASGATDTAPSDIGGSSVAIKRLIERLSEPDGGFTVDVFSGSDKGAPGQFAVSIAENRARAMPVEQLEPEHISTFVRDNLAMFRQSENYFGGWHDPKTHQVFLDISHVVNSRAEAVELRTRYHQDAYFDFGAGRSVKPEQDAEFASERVARRAEVLLHERQDRQDEATPRQGPDGQAGAAEIRAGRIPQDDGQGADARADREGEGGARALAEWDESAHPRDDTGKFTDSGGAAGGVVTGRGFDNESGYQWHEQGPVAEWGRALSKEDRRALTDYASFGYHDTNDRLRGTYEPPTVRQFVRDATPEEEAQIHAAGLGGTDWRGWTDIQVADGTLVHNHTDPEHPHRVEREVPDEARVADLDAKTAQINATIAERGYALPEAVVVGRAAYLPGISEDDLKAAVGTVRTEAGFTSTMLGPAQNRLETYIANGKYESLYNRYGPSKADKVKEVGTAVKFTITLPEGTKVASVEAARRTNYAHETGKDDLHDKQSRSESEVLLGSGARFRIDSVEYGGTSHWLSFSTPYLHVRMTYVGGGSSEGAR